MRHAEGVMSVEMAVHPALGGTFFCRLFADFPVSRVLSCAKTTLLCVEAKTVLVEINFLII